MEQRIKQISARDVADVLDMILYNGPSEFKDSLEFGFNAIEQLSSELRDSERIFVLGTYTKD